MTEEQILHNLINQYLAIGIPLHPDQINPKISYTNSLTVLGKCKKQDGRYTIYLSRHALKDQEQIRNTLAHELIHTLYGCMNHGKKFHYYAAIIQKKLGIHIDSRASKSEAENSGIKEAYRENARYKIVCNDCGAIIYRQKRSSLIVNPSRYRCGKCGGKLIVYSRI